MAGEGLLAIHEVADEDEEHDEDVEVQRRGEEEVVKQEQESLNAVPALDGADDARSSGGAGRMGGYSETDGG